MKELVTLLQPVVTEKATDMAQKGKYEFFVASDATKIDVKKAVKKIYGAGVLTVRMINTHPKKRFMTGKRVLVKKAEMKKAIVTLRKGEKTIDVNKIKVKA